MGLVVAAFGSAKRVFKHILVRFPLASLFLPGTGYPDQARLITQGNAFKRVMANLHMTGRCLNAGAGEGLYTNFLESVGSINEIVDVDISDNLLKQTEPSALSHRRVVASLTDLPFEDGYFDSCLCSEVLEHIEDDAKAVAELSRVLKPGGLLIVSVPTPPAPFDKAHVREGYSLQQIGDLLQGAGFSVVRHLYCFHMFMRLLMKAWDWQFSILGRRRRNFFPRFGVVLLAYADRLVLVGPPWDLIVVAIKS